MIDGYDENIFLQHFTIDEQITIQDIILTSFEYYDYSPNFILYRFKNHSRLSNVLLNKIKENYNLFKLFCDYVNYKIWQNLD